MAKVANGKVYSEEFATKGAIPSFGRLEAFGKGSGLPGIVYFLLKSPPTATSEASVMTQSSASGFG